MDCEDNFLELQLNGLLHEAAVLKKKYLECYALADIADDASFDVTLSYVKALVWLERFFEAERILFRINIDRLAEKQKKILIVAKANIGLLIRGAPLYSEGFNSEFGKIVHGKDVAIVAPGMGRIDWSGAHDVLVSFNGFFPSLAQKFDLDYSKSISNIGYFSNQYFKERFDDSLGLLRDKKIDFAVVNGVKSTQVSLSAYEAKVRAISPFVLCFKSALFGVQRCLYDLLLFAPKKITIYNCDLYTKYPFHKKGYAVSVSEKTELLRSWYIHDLAFNFNFSKTIVAVGGVAGDVGFNDAIGLSLRDYLMRLEFNIALM